MKYYIDSNIGVVREENQDRAQVFQNDHALVAVLCDGMGGHFGGSLASSITIDTFRQRMIYLTKDIKSDEEISTWFEETIRKSKQNMVLEAGNDKNKKDMGTTVTSAIILKNENKIIVFNIGDSRTYIFDGLLTQITTDHNLMNYYVEHEGMSEFEASKLPGAAALTSALGPNKKTNIQGFSIEQKKGKKTLILTSDGIHDFIAKPRIEIVIDSDKSLEEKTKTLINDAIKNGSTDNLTCVIVEVE